MLEVVFDQSASISLLMGQKYGKGVFPEDKGTPGFLAYGWEISSEEDLEAMQDEWLAEERENWEKAVPLGGKASDIFCFDMVLNIGGIDDSVFEEERKRVFKRFDYTEIDEIEPRMKKYRQRLIEFCLLVQDGEPVRIWHGQGAEEMCGLLWLCHEMVRRGLPLDKLHLARLEKLRSTEIREGEWGKLAGDQTLIESEEVRFYASQWEALKEANAMLRVAVNGCVLSATEDFYDELISREIEKMDREFRQPKLVGRLLDQEIGVRDLWIAYRLDRFVAHGLLEVVAVDHECPWIRILKRKD